MRNAFAKVAAAMLAAHCVIGLPSPCEAGFLPVYGVPLPDVVGEYGYAPGIGSGIWVNESGTVVSNEAKYYHDAFAGPVQIGTRAVRWSSSGAVTELETLDNPLFHTYTFAAAIDPTGRVVGSAGSVNGSGGAAQWDADDAKIVILTNPDRHLGGVALATNSSGTIVGQAEDYDPAVGPLGWRAVRWDAAGVPTALGHLGATPQGQAFSEPAAINELGDAVGISQRILPNGLEMGLRAVRWNAGESGAIELGNLGTQANGLTYSEAFDINASGVAIGVAEKYDELGRFLGLRAVRWDATGTEATELGVLGTNSSGVSLTDARAINDLGFAVGGGGKGFGSCAVIWPPSGVEPIEFDVLSGSDPGSECFAQSLNNAGVAVGWCKVGPVGASADYRAVYFDPRDGAAVDLNTLIDPESGWLLTAAQSISDTGWIAGEALYYPSGAVGDGGYFVRHFLLQAPGTAVPEPSSHLLLAMVVVSCLAWSGRKKFRNGAHRIACGG